MSSPSLPIDSNTETKLRTAAERRILRVRKRIHSVEAETNRMPNSVRLVAKGVSYLADAVIEVARHLPDICEQFLPEGVTKRSIVNRSVRTVNWHYTGELTPENIFHVVEHFNWIHTLDQVALLKDLEKAIRDVRPDGIRVLIEVNPLGRAKRMGAEPKEAKELVKRIESIPGAKLSGFSFHAEEGMSEEAVLDGYRATSDLCNHFFREGSLPYDCKVLAMGRSCDFEEAIRLGANIVRVGKAVFGPRQSGSSLQSKFPANA